MDISKILLNAGEALRPALTKIIPMKMLSRIKAGVINNAADKLSADAIIKYEHGYYKEGANVIGNVKGDNGLGQSIRIMCRLLDENNEEHVIKDFLFHQEAQEQMIHMMTGLQTSFRMMLI